ncbi:hypothetical protein AMECASPLE_008052 [Ameca splendens]|uniref:Uncharacterized protein n=1 Tax=Ameca splendens TaxID=208324 RepID=A0ABV0Y0A2_9TELE
MKWRNSHSSISVCMGRCLCSLTSLETKQHLSPLLCGVQSLLLSNVGHSVFSMEDLREVGAEAQYLLSFLAFRGPPKCRLAYLLCNEKRFSFCDWRGLMSEVIFPKRGLNEDT